MGSGVYVRYLKGIRDGYVQVDFRVHEKRMD